LSLGLEEVGAFGPRTIRFTWKRSEKTLLRCNHPAGGISCRNGDLIRFAIGGQRGVSCSFNL